MKRINICIEDDLLNKIDSYVQKRYVSRSGLISFVLSMYLDTIDVDFSSFSYAPEPTTGRAES